MSGRGLIAECGMDVAAKNVGAPTFLNWQHCAWSAGACSRFITVSRSVRAIDGEVGLSTQKRRRAAALQNCRRADNSKKWKLVFGVPR